MAYNQASIDLTNPLDTERVEFGASRIRALAEAIAERLESVFVDVDADPLVLKPAGLPTIVDGLSLSGGLVVATGDIEATAGDFVGSGAGLTDLPAAELSGTLPALNGAALTGLNASNISTGTLNAARLPTIPFATQAGQAASAAAVIAGDNELTLDGAETYMMDFNEVPTTYLRGPGGSSVPVSDEYGPDTLTTRSNNSDFFLRVRIGTDIRYIRMEAWS